MSMLEEYDLKSVFFGFSDAQTEADRNPKEFLRSFFDIHEHLIELINGTRFMVIGNKGAGKSAYGAKILLNQEQYNIIASYQTLSNFDNNIFDKLKTFETLGSNQYISLWKCILMIESVKLLESSGLNIQNEEYIRIFDALTRVGLLENTDDVSIIVSKLSETDLCINVNNIFKQSRKKKHYEELQGAGTISTAIFKAIKNLYFKESFVLIIDGLDDILSNDSFEPNIITGLIRAIDELNKQLSHSTINLKIIVLIRNDVLNVCRDSNISKIIRDSGIKLSWKLSNDIYNSDLIKLVEKRFNSSWKTNYTFKEIWEAYFPETIYNDKNSLLYVLDNIIYRPRDILQFFVEAQKEFKSNTPFSEEQVQTILSNYSNEYFIDAMRDELTGFFPNEIITILPDIMSKIGDRCFYLNVFEEECKKHKEFKNIENISEILKKLFEVGYIGQHRQRTDKEYTVFSYRNEREKFNDEDECIVHRGLLRGLTI